jgi:hypothetical protein
MKVISHGDVTSPNTQLTPISHRMLCGNVVDGTNIAQTSRAQPSSTAVSMTIEVAVIDLEIPALAASCNLEATATRPVGK